MPLDPLIALLVVTGLLVVAVGLLVRQWLRARERPVRRAGLPSVMLPALDGKHSPITRYALAAAVAIGVVVVTLMRHQPPLPAPPSGMPSRGTQPLAATVSAAREGAPQPAAGAREAEASVTNGGPAHRRTAGSPPQGPGLSLAPPASGEGMGETQWCGRGDSMMAAGEYAMAQQAYLEALRLSPQSARARTGQARAARAERARQAHEEAMARQAEAWGAQEGAPPAAYAPRASALSRMAAGSRPGAGAAIPPEPDHGAGWSTQEDARYHRSQADSLLARSLPSLAIREYEKALQSNPADAGAVRGLEEARRRADQMQRAPGGYAAGAGAAPSRPERGEARSRP